VSSDIGLTDPTGKATGAHWALTRAPENGETDRLVWQGDSTVLVLHLRDHTVPPGPYRLTARLETPAGPTPTREETVYLAADTLTEAQSYPNPWRASQNAGQPLSFRDVPPQSVIDIYTLSGDRVRSLQVDNGPAQWDLTNDNGSPIASGVYLFQIKNGPTTQRGKLAIQR
jgi:hypothetical protein